jgi:uncharacterized protein
MYSIAALYIYPIKGLGRISVQKAYVETEGLQYDRRWMIVTKSDNKFISQRSHPIMTHFNVEIDDEGFVTISYNDDEIKFHAVEYIDKIFYQATIWDDKVKSVEVSKSVSQWLSKQLGEACMLVKMANDSKRIKVVKATASSTFTSYADAYPILILGTASMEELNKRSPEPMTDLRFRPNILLNTTVPHEEDELMSLIINDDVIVSTVKPCVRCQVIQIDPTTAESGVEPLKTLSDYRRINREILFGSNAIVLEEGMIKVGQEVKRLEQS